MIFAYSIFAYSVFTYSIFAYSVFSYSVFAYSVFAYFVVAYSVVAYSVFACLFRVCIFHVRLFRVCLFRVCQLLKVLFAWKREDIRSDVALMKFMISTMSAVGVQNWPCDGCRTDCWFFLRPGNCIKFRLE